MAFGVNFAGALSKAGYDIADRFDKADAIRRAALYQQKLDERYENEQLYKKERDKIGDERYTKGQEYQQGRDKMTDALEWDKFVERQKQAAAEEAYRKKQLEIADYNAKTGRISVTRENGKEKTKDKKEQAPQWEAKDYLSNLYKLRDLDNKIKTDPSYQEKAGDATIGATASLKRDIENRNALAAQIAAYEKAKSGIKARFDQIWNRPPPNKNTDNPDGLTPPPK